MTNKLYKWTLSVPPTLNEVCSLEIVPPSDEGAMFRIEKGWIAAVMDAIVATDSLQFQISTKSQHDNASLYGISSEFEVYTECYDFHLAEAAITSLDDPTKKIKLRDIEGTLLEAGKKYYLNVLVTGQAGATAASEVVFLGHMVGTKVDTWYDNSF